ncbi:hypothetical protein KY362_02210 [Candidatus Woesearchaeota archaeon]|nr:hypothetical protein [Candidatus Woesearchaeota archaeon]
MADPYGAMAPGLMAAGAGVAIVFILFGLALYIYAALALMYIAKRSKTKNGWLAFIPIANVYLMTQIGKQSGWWTVGILAGMIPFIGGLAVAALMIFLWWKIAEKVHKPGWWGILMILPVVNLVLMGIMAWGKK